MGEGDDEVWDSPRGCGWQWKKEVFTSTDMSLICLVSKTAPCGEER
jgi:hypothetical protein